MQRDNSRDFIKKKKTTKLDDSGNDQKQMWKRLNYFLENSTDVFFFVRFYF